MDVIKSLTLQDIDPVHWAKVAHQFIHSPRKMLKKVYVPASITCNHIHIGITQYLQLYLLVNGGTVEVVDENVLIATFDKCVALDGSFSKFRADCKIIGTYSNEITCPGGGRF